MSIEALKQELANLDGARRSEIVAYLVALEDRSNPDYRAALTRKIDDKDPAHWLTLEEFDRRLSITDEEKSE